MRGLLRENGEAGYYSVLAPGRELRLRVRQVRGHQRGVRVDHLRDAHVLRVEAPLVLEDEVNVRIDAGVLRGLGLGLGGSG